MRNWVFYNLIVGFAVYWASNLILWYPWSYSTVLGMTLMLTLNPLLWLLASYSCLRRYQGEKLWQAAVANSMVFLLLAAVMDYVFFGLIRQAMEDLYHPTTFYGYAFVLCVPFLVLTVFGKAVFRPNKALKWSDFLQTGVLGVACFALLVLILIYDLSI